MPLVFPAPPISLSTAHAFVAFFTFSYVGSLYVSKNTRLSFKHGVSLNVRDGEKRVKQADERWRNDPDVIRARLFAATMSTVGSVLAVYWLVGSVIPEVEVCTRCSNSYFSSVSWQHGVVVDDRVRIGCGVLGCEGKRVTLIDIGRCGT